MASGLEMPIKKNIYRDLQYFLGAENTVGPIPTETCLNKPVVSNQGSVSVLEIDRINNLGVSKLDTL